MAITQTLGRRNKKIFIGAEQKFKYRDADGRPFDTGTIGLLRRHPDVRCLYYLSDHHLWGKWIFTGAQRNRQQHGLVEYSSPPFEIHPIVSSDKRSAPRDGIDGFQRGNGKYSGIHLDNVVDRVFHDMLVHRAMTKHFDNPLGRVQLSHIHFNISYNSVFRSLGILLEQYIMPCLSLLWATHGDRVWVRNPLDSEGSRRNRYHIGTGHVMSEESIKAGLALLAGFVYGLKEKELDFRTGRTRNSFRYSASQGIFTERDYGGYVGNALVSELDYEIAVHGRKAKLKVDERRRKITIEDFLKSIIEAMEPVIIRYCGRENFNLLAAVAEGKRLIDIDYNGTGNHASTEHTAMIDDSYFANHGTTAQALIKGFQHTELSRMYVDIACIADYLHSYYAFMSQHNPGKLTDDFHADVIDWDRAIFYGGREHPDEQYTVYFDRFPKLREILKEEYLKNPDLKRVNSRIRKI